jgi:hypothetical protein
MRIGVWSFGSPNWRFPSMHYVWRDRNGCNCFCLLATALALGCLSCGVCAPKPFISSVSPTGAAAGGNQFL